MTKFILHFPAAQRTALKCVWTLTGDPGRPLVCRWEESEPSLLSRSSFAAARPQNRRICA
ncbi:MAG: hypothetical protein RB191_17505 [Terriglobia bacterium]|nr:hypothetical protein [Terriglobia bacterium]